MTKVNFKPFNNVVRHVKCMRCGEWGHRSGDRECRLANENPNDTERRLREDPISYMNPSGATGPSSALAPSVQGHYASEGGGEGGWGDPDSAFLKSLSSKEKRRLLKRLQEMEATEENKAGRGDDDDDDCDKDRSSTSRKRKKERKDDRERGKEHSRGKKRRRSRSRSRSRGKNSEGNKSSKNRDRKDRKRETQSSSNSPSARSRYNKGRDQQGRREKERNQLSTAAARNGRSADEPDVQGGKKGSTEDDVKHSQRKRSRRDHEDGGNGDKKERARRADGEGDVVGKEKLSADGADASRGPKEERKGRSWRDDNEGGNRRDKGKGRIVEDRGEARNRSSRGKEDGDDQTDGNRHHQNGATSSKLRESDRQWEDMDGEGGHYEGRQRKHHSSEGKKERKRKERGRDSRS